MVTTTQSHNGWSLNTVLYMALLNMLLSSQLTLSKAERASLYDKAQFSYKTLGKLHIWRYLERAQ